VLFRNFIKTVKESEKYTDYSITLCGNIIWKDLAESFDNNIIDRFIWIYRNSFYKNPFYKYKILKQIRETGFEVIIDPTYTREILFSDTIVKYSGALIRIGSSGALDKHTKWRRKLLTNKYYTNLIYMRETNLFEFNRNKEFFEKILDVKLNIQTTHLDVSIIKESLNLKNPFAVIFPGAAAAERRWNANNFAAIGDFIASKYLYNIIIAGTAKENEQSSIIISLMKNKEKVIDYTGKTNLTQLIKLISDAAILIANDTGAVHISAAVKTPFVCISNGNHLGRFHPYPVEIFSRANYVYPEEIRNNFNDPETIEKYRFESHLNINSITANEVIEVIQNEWYKLI